MYLPTVVLLLIVLPFACTAIELLLLTGDVVLVGAKWLVFWAVGVRLFVAGIRQVFQPGFTAQTIFGLKDEGAFGVVREVGFGNLSMGTLGLLSLAIPGWVVPAALVGGLYYLLAGLGHARRTSRNSHEQTAMITDFLAGGLLLAFVVAQAL